MSEGRSVRDRIAARLYRRLGKVPTGGIGRPRRRVRLVCVLAVRDELRFLDGFLRNVAPHVDGIVALDDGSADGSGAVLARHPAVLEVLHNPPDREQWDEVADFKALLAAAHRHGADWIVSLDADHRVEEGFRDRAERAIRRARLAGMSALSFHIRELWDSPDHYRVDGIWGAKNRVALWAARSDHAVDERRLHALKVPQQSRWHGVWPLADLEVYHLRMLASEDRRARRERYEELDPEATFQPQLGYAYLTDERGLRLRAIPRRRDYRR